MAICPFYSDQKEGCTLKREWGLCIKRVDYFKYEYYWKMCHWYRQEKERENRRVA